MLSIKSYGAKGDGTADDFAAIQSALDSGEKEIYIPMGIYCVSGTLLVHSDTHIVADKETMKTIPAVVLKNLTNEKITANGSEYIIFQKGDVLAIPEFVNLKVNKF